MTLALLAAFTVVVKPVPLLFRHRLVAKFAREISLWRWQRQHRRRPQAPKPTPRGRRAARAYVFQAHRPAAFPAPEDVGGYVSPVRAPRRSAVPTRNARPSSV